MRISAKRPVASHRFNAESVINSIHATVLEVTGVAGETLDIIVDGSSTTPAVGMLFLGNSKPKELYRTGHISGVTPDEVWRFVNIKNGNPTN